MRYIASALCLIAMLGSEQVRAWDPSGTYTVLQEGTWTGGPNALIAIQADITDDGFTFFSGMGSANYTITFDAGTSSEVTISWLQGGTKVYNVLDKIAILPVRGNKYRITLFVGKNGMLVGGALSQRLLARQSITPIYFGVGQHGLNDISKSADSIRANLAAWNGQVFMFVPDDGQSVWDQMTSEYSSRSAPFEDFAPAAISALVPVIGGN